jgi:acetylornithine/N-succinyldiaminopimelate aminotransferase
VPIGACLVAASPAACSSRAITAPPSAATQLATTAALTTIDVIETDQLIDNAIAVGRLIRDGLAEALAGSKGVVDIRGQGLMIGIELDRPCGELVNRGLAAGLLINVTADKVVRLLPPLTFDADEARQLVSRLAKLIVDFLATA